MAIKNVTHIVGPTFKGGVATYVNDLIQYQSNSPEVAKIDILVSEPVASEVVARLEAIDNVSVHTYIGTNENRSKYEVYQQIDSIVQQIKPDVIHVHDGFLAGEYARQDDFIVDEKRVPIIFTSHGLYVENPVTGEKKHSNIERERRYLPKTDASIHVSEAEKALAIKYGLFREGKDIVINNGVRDCVTSDEHPLERDDNKINIGFLGRFDQIKGFDILEHALDNVKRDDYVLHMIGGNKEEVPNVTLEWLDNPHIKTYGWVDSEKVDDYLKDIDVLVVPSLYESFGLVALEAIRNSKPVIVSNSGGLPGIVNSIDEKCGFVFDIKDPHTLSKIIDEISHEKLVDMGKNGRMAYERNFTQEAAFEPVLQCYDTVIKNCLQSKDAARHIP